MSSQVKVFEEASRLRELLVRRQHGCFEEQGEIRVGRIDFEGFEIGHLEVMDRLLRQWHEAREAELRGESAGQIEALRRLPGQEEEVCEGPQDDVAALQVHHAVVDEMQGEVAGRGQRQEPRLHRAGPPPQL